MKHIDLIKNVQKFGQQVGPREALKALILKGLAPTTAEKLLRGAYPVSSLRSKTEKIISAVLLGAAKAKSKKK